METELQGFHEGEQFSTNTLLSNDEVMKHQLQILENFKLEDGVLWDDESELHETVVGKEDFHQIMSDWQSHVGLPQISEPDDIGVSLDLLSSSDILHDDKSPILSKVLYNSVQKLENITPTTEELDIKKECFLENEQCELSSEIQSFQKCFPKCKKLEPTVVRKLTLVNGEKEILGKNIIGLHSLNEIKENPDQNCQVTSTIINGKRYKVIIKPKSQKVQKYNEKIKKTLIRKLSRCNILPKMEPKEDEIISEMRNGNYDVPILGNTLLNWDMTWVDTTWDNSGENVLSEIKNECDTETLKKVPPLKIKIPKNKKCKKKSTEVKSDEEIDVETISDKRDEKSAVVSLETLDLKQDIRTKEEVNNKKICNKSNKNSLAKAMIDHIESLKLKKDGRIPLVQVLPTKKNVKNGTRMQDAAATINRNKLLKLVSGGDTVQLDHDYCSNTVKNFDKLKTEKNKSNIEMNLTEKNPKKDSGMESGDVSDASEDPQTPDSVQNIHSMQHINNILIEQRKNGKANNITKVAADFFRAANVFTSNGNVNSDVVKTLVVSNGNKALTNDSAESSLCKAGGDKSDIVPSNNDSSSVNEILNSNEVKPDVNDIKLNSSSDGQAPGIQSERPKKKLKLEEYLSRRNRKVGESRTDSNTSNNLDNNPGNSAQAIETNTMQNVSEEKETKKDKLENEEKMAEEKYENTRQGTVKGRKSRRYRGQRSPSTSSGERDNAKDKERSPKTRSTRRSSRRDSWHKRKHRNSTSSDRRRSIWSRSVSRSSSRESSSSSCRSGSRRSHKFKSVWYHRRSRSRSISRERSRSRNRSYSNWRRQNHYFNRDIYSRRSRSPYRNYSMREKQRQIEERRVIYIGRIEEGMTNAKLRERFSVFGPIVDISLHFREYGDNYGFVTYAYKDHAYNAIEHGNDDPTLPRYDLCFGGRRGFCKERYADLDGMPTSYSGFKGSSVLQSSEESFDLLLKKAQAKLKKRINKNNPST